MSEALHVLVFALCAGLAGVGFAAVTGFIAYLILVKKISGR